MPNRANGSSAEFANTLGDEHQSLKTADLRVHQARGGSHENVGRSCANESSSSSGKGKRRRPNRAFSSRAISSTFAGSISDTGAEEVVRLTVNSLLCAIYCFGLLHLLNVG